MACGIDPPPRATVTGDEYPKGADLVQATRMSPILRSASLLLCGWRRQLALPGPLAADRDGRRCRGHAEDDRVSGRSRDLLQQPELHEGRPLLDEPGCVREVA